MSYQKFETVESKINEVISTLYGDEFQVPELQDSLKAVGCPYALVIPPILKKAGVIKMDGVTKLSRFVVERINYSVIKDLFEEAIQVYQHKSKNINPSVYEEKIIQGERTADEDRAIKLLKSLGYIIQKKIITESIIEI